MAREIVFVNETSELGGAESVLLFILEKLDRNRWQPTVVLPEQGPLVQKCASLQVPVTIIPGCPHWSISFYLFGHHKFPNPIAWILNLLAGIVWIFRLYLFFRSHSTAILQTNSMIAHVMAGFAGKVAKLPVVWHFQDIVMPDSGWGMYYKVLLFFANSIPTKILCISNAVKNQFSGIRNFGTRAILLENSIDLDQYSFQEKKRDGIIRIGTAARLTPWKGQEDAIKAARLLKQQGVPFLWSFAGGTALGSESYLEKLRKLVLEYDLAKEVIFKGRIEKMPEFYTDLDILVHLPIEPEPFGLVVIEGMACGVVVIATPGGAADKHLVAAGGALVAISQPEAVAEWIEFFSNHRDLLSQAQIQASQYVQAHFDGEMYRTKLEGVYLSLEGMK